MHRSPMILLVSLLVASAMAGCTSGDDDTPSQGPPDDGDDTPGNGTAGPGGGGGSGGAPPPGAGAGGNGSSPGAGANGTAGDGNSTWTYDNRTGDVSGLGLGADQPGAEEAFDVAAGVATLSLDVGVEGDALDVEVRPPDCADSSCASTGSATEGGNYTLVMDAPSPGSWTLVLTASGLGPQSATYAAAIGQETRADGGNTTTP